MLDFDKRFRSDSLDRHKALRFLDEEWFMAFKIPEELAFFGPSSRVEYMRLPTAIWRAVSNHGLQKLRFYTAGQLADWDLGSSPLRDLLYRLAGQQIAVEVCIPTNLLDHLQEGDRYLLASLADHPGITVVEVQQLPMCGEGRLIAESIGSHPRRWATSQARATAFGPDWGQDPAPLIMSDTQINTPKTEKDHSAASLRPQHEQVGDLEIEARHELDGKLQGFGSRLWALLQQHLPANLIMTNAEEELVSLTYHDRYLYTPISIALLTEMISGLRDTLGRNRWDVDRVEVQSYPCKLPDASRIRHKLWSDWYDTNARNAVLIATLDYLGLNARIETDTTGKLIHGRVLQLGFSSGKSIILRLDQGVSYWHVSDDNPPVLKDFDLNLADHSEQARKLAELNVNICGSDLPTQLFVKVR